MGRFGDELRQERERQGLSLEAISWSTKIAERYLLALEHEDFDQLPGGVFRKGFLRSYLRALQMDETAWTARFDEAIGATGVAASDPAGYEELARNVARARGVKAGSDDRRRWSGVFAMLVLLLAFGWCLWHFALEGRVAFAGQGTSEVRLPVAGERSAAPADAAYRRSAAA